MSPQKALEQIYSTSKAEELLKRSKKTAIQLARAIERNYPHRIGELGLDIGIDKGENIWMFEANSKPGRSIFKHRELKEQGIASMRYIFDHCLYLSDFVPTDGGDLDGH